MTTLAELETQRKAQYIDPENPDKNINAYTIVSNNDVLEKLNRFMRGKSKVIHFDVDDIQDQDWVAESPFVNGVNFSSVDEDRRFWSTADRKFEDTSMGGNYVCNPRPSYTPYADVPKPGLLERDIFSPLSRADNLGMGTYHSEAIDDSYQVLDLRFGKPEYNSMAGFFSSFYSAKDALLANTGVYSPAFYAVGQAAGTVAMFTLLGPLVSVSILAVSWVGGFVQGVIATNPHKFWYVRPTMPLYWRAVHNIVNSIMAYKGLYTGIQPGPLDMERGTVDTDVLKQLQRLAPNVFDDNGAINVRQVINRAERINQKLTKELEKVIESAGSYEDMLRALDRMRGTIGKDVKPVDEELYTGTYADGVRPAEGEKATINTLMAGTMEERFGDRPDVDNEEAMQEAFTSAPLAAIKSRAKRFWDYLSMEMADGSAFASFRVDHTGSVSETFSHSTMKNDLGEKFNQMSGQGRAAHFTFAGGNALPGVGDVLNAAKATMAGALSAVKLDGLLSLAGSAYVDIPEGWENAAYQAPSMNYTMRLVSPYGHPLAQLQHIYIPLAMILAGVMPHAAGRAAYTQPFFCEAYDRGRGIVRNGIISQVVITRGVSNLGFNKTKDALAVDIQFTIKDLSSVLYMPIEMGTNIDPKKTIHTYDTAYSDYIATLGSATLGQNIYKGQKLKVRARQWLNNTSQYTTVDHWAGFVRNLPGVELLDVFWPDSGRGN